MVVEAPNRAQRRRTEREEADSAPMMTFAIPERIILLQVLPNEGDIVSLKIIRDLRSNLGFTEYEVEAAGIETEGMNVRWNPEAIRDMDKEVPVGKKAKEIIRGGFEAMPKMPMGYLQLYERFEESEEEE